MAEILPLKKIGEIFDTWPEAVALGEKMDHVPVYLGMERSHAVLAETHKRGLPVSGHCYGREFVAAYAASGITDTHEAIDRDICEDFLEAGLWIFMRAGNPGTAWHAMPDIIKVWTELGVSPKRLCVCTDDRDADDLFIYGLDWCVRHTTEYGVSNPMAWSFGSLHPALRYGMDNEVGGLGHSRRADIVLLDDELNVKNTWYGGELMVEDGAVTTRLDTQLENDRWAYPKAAYETIRLPQSYKLSPEMPDEPVIANTLRCVLPGVASLQHPIKIDPAESWQTHFDAHDLCFLAVVERYGLNGNVGLGLLQNFHLTEGAVASSVGHDAHNIVVAGVDEADMRLCVETIREHRGGIVIVVNGEVKACVPIPIAGLLSDKRATEVQAETIVFKKVWDEMGFGIPYMGFNLLSLSVIPDFRLTDKGLVVVKEMRLVPLFETPDKIQ